MSNATVSSVLFADLLVHDINKVKRLHWDFVYIFDLAPYGQGNCLRVGWSGLRDQQADLKELATGKTSAKSFIGLIQVELNLRNYIESSL